MVRDRPALELKASYVCTQSDMLQALVGSLLDTGITVAVVSAPCTEAAQMMPGRGRQCGGIFRVLSRECASFKCSPEHIVHIGAHGLKLAFVTGYLAVPAPHQGQGH